MRNLIKTTDFFFLPWLTLSVTFNDKVKVVNKELWVVIKSDWHNTNRSCRVTGRVQSRSRRLGFSVTKKQNKGDSQRKRGSQPIGGQKTTGRRSNTNRQLNKLDKLVFLFCFALRDDIISVVYHEGRRETHTMFYRQRLYIMRPHR